MSQFFAEDSERIALNEQQREMLEKWNRLSDSQKSSLLSLMDSM